MRPAPVALAAIATLLAGVTASVLPFLQPDTGAPARADAVVVLSGDRGERLARAMELLEQGVAPTLVLDGEPDSPRALELCRGGQPFEVVCLRPDPDDTREEARAAGRLAAERGWRRLIVSTSTYHVTRAALLFRRCVAADVTAVDGRPQLSRRAHVRAVAREWLATGYLLVVDRGC